MTAQNLGWTYAELVNCERLTKNHKLNLRKIYAKLTHASLVEREYTSCGEAIRTDVELTVRGDDVPSDSSSDTIELSPQVTVRGPVAGSTGPPSYGDYLVFRFVACAVWPFDGCHFTLDR